MTRKTHTPQDLTEDDLEKATGGTSLDALLVINEINAADDGQPLVETAARKRPGRKKYSNVTL